jgi:hypothetical protein
MVVIILNFIFSSPLKFIIYFNFFEHWEEAPEIDALPPINGPTL